MVTIRLKGQVTSDGHLEFDPPDNLPPGDVEITIEFSESGDTFTPDEIADLLTFTPQSGADVVANGLIGGWETKDITNPVAWVEEQRRKQQENRG